MTSASNVQIFGKIRFIIDQLSAAQGHKFQCYKSFSVVLSFRLDLNTTHTIKFYFTNFENVSLKTQKQNKIKNKNKKRESKAKEKIHFPVIVNCHPLGKDLLGN